jgi:metal-responsive CopG/Arc/MetJ family transcriptional regulator
METTVSLPNEVFQKAEEVAAALGISRDELYAAALLQYLREKGKDEITEKLNQVYAETESEIDEISQRLQLVSLPVEQW